jgi:uncharacterized protein (TIRG00374 family)
MSEAKHFKISQVLIPVGIGIIVIVWLFLDDFSPDSFSDIDLSLYSAGFILLAFLLMFGRDMGLIWRFRTLTDKKLSWRQAFNIHILNEFTSAVTPSAVGGSALVVLFLNKEGINVGRSTAIMIANLFLDELFFVIICPVIFLLIPLADLFNVSSVIASTIGVLFWTVYAILVLWTGILYVILFLRPDLISGLFRLIFRLPFLRRWHYKIELFSESLTTASHEIKMKSYRFWMKAFATTSLAWILRFMVINALFMAFTPINNHLVVFGRQIMLWIVMVLSPTPGGSGLTEIAFREYYNDLLLGSGTVLLIIFIWRIITYYMYILAGIIIIPKWIEKSFVNNKP